MTGLLKSLLLCMVANFSLLQADAVTELRFGAAEPVASTAYAFNSNLLMVTALHGISYGSETFGKAIKELRPGGLRFPGGTTANNYL